MDINLSKAVSQGPKQNRHLNDQADSCCDADPIHKINLASSKWSSFCIHCCFNKFALLISNKIWRNRDSAYQAISCVRCWSGPFGPNCKEKGLKMERVLFDIVIVVGD